jgi:hypothetical protein
MIPIYKIGLDWIGFLVYIIPLFSFFGLVSFAFSEQIALSVSYLLQCYIVGLSLLFEKERDVHVYSYLNG